MPSQQNNASNKSLIAKLMFVSALLFFLIFPLVVMSSPLVDSFDTYDLGNLVGQGDWLKDSGDEDYAKVVDDESKDGTKSVYFVHTADGNQDSVYKLNEFACIESIGFWFKAVDTDDTNGWAGFYVPYVAKFRLGFSAKEIEVVFLEGSEILGSFVEDTWHSGDIEWNCNTKKVRYRFDGGDWTEWKTNFNDTSDIPEKAVMYYWGKGELNDYYFDRIAKRSLLWTPVGVWGVSPDSATEITDLNTNFTFGFEDLEDYDGLLISFYNQTTRIHTNALRFDTDEIGFEGEEVVNLQDFYFEKNADWHLHALAFWEQPETYEGLYLTGRYITEYTYDIVEPEYFLTINIEGFTTIFEMEDWETWYGEHAEQFEAPTLLFGRVATLFAPTFQNIGEFGQRILDYFEVDLAYSRGYELGLAIPIFNFYLTEIEVFFGGLPVMKLFLMTLILMVGIFLFKIVMKFIPFFG